MKHSMPMRASIVFRGWLITILLVTGCSAAQIPVSSTGPQDAPPLITALASTPPPATSAPAETVGPAATPEWRAYTNSALGLSFHYPSAWYGPDVYEWEQGVRLEVGSDRVYPYGTDRTERVNEIQDSYFVVVQYVRNSNNWTLDEYQANQPWVEAYQALLALKDGETLSGLRNASTRVRQLQVGRFVGLESVATLSESAQTERFYAREAVLFDEHLNLLRVTGSPNNVKMADPSYWQEAYRQVDEANLVTFRRLLESVEIE